MVDGDPHDRALAVAMLTSALSGARIEEAATVPAFTQAVAGGRYDVVVVEPALAWAGGAELLETIRICQPGAAVVVLTRAADATAAADALKAGAADFFVKSSQAYLQLAAAVQAAGARAMTPGSDVERLLEQVRELKASNRTLAEFPFTAAHELEAPLRMVDRQLAVLQEARDGLDGEARAALDSAVAGTRHLQGLIDSLLTYSRLGAGPPVLSACDCNALVDQAIAQVRAHDEVGDAAITRGDLPVVQADSARLLLVFRNLLANAVKFRADKRPQVVVSARAGTDHVVFSVRDNGIGIDPQSAGRLFGMFQRLHPEYPGTGLGLVICQRIIEQHGGRIWVESEAGAGATFFFTIPDTPARAG